MKRFFCQFHPVCSGFSIMLPFPVKQCFSYTKTHFPLKPSLCLLLQQLPVFSSSFAPVPPILMFALVCCNHCASFCSLFEPVSFFLFICGKKEVTLVSTLAAFTVTSSSYVIKLSPLFSPSAPSCSFPTMQLPFHSLPFSLSNYPFRSHKNCLLLSFTLTPFPISDSLPFPVSHPPFPLPLPFYCALQKT